MTRFYFDHIHNMCNMYTSYTNLTEFNGYITCRYRPFEMLLNVTVLAYRLILTLSLCSSADSAAL